MDPKTTEHLETAARNQELAYALLGPPSPINVHPPPVEWAVVIAFYAAVHYVNAYLWERQRYAPRDHTARRHAVMRVASLRLAEPAYRNLQDLAYRARYQPGIRLSRTEVEQALHVDLQLVEQTVLAALNAAR